MSVFRPPGRIVKREARSIFLAGTIDTGNSVDWQQDLIGFFRDNEVDIYNPRRDEWDESWVQKAENPVFAEQVHWELEAMALADIIIMNFLPASQSPVTLLELGLHASSKKLWVCCPDDYWRSGNVHIVCDKYGIPLYKSMEQLLTALNIG